MCVEEGPIRVKGLFAILGGSIDTVVKFDPTLEKLPESVEAQPQDKSLIKGGALLRENFLSLSKGLSMSAWHMGEVMERP